jgi:hypothetical protein
MNVRISRALVAGATLALFTGILAPSAAQAQTRFGVEAAWGNDVDIGAGAFAKFHLTELSGKAVTGRGEFIYFFPSSVTGAYSWHFLEANFDGLVDLNGGKSSMKPYVGAGLGWMRSSFSYNNGYCGVLVNCDASSSDIGVNAIFGLNFGESKMAPFVEAKYELRSGGQLVLKGGVHFK